MIFYDILEESKSYIAGETLEGSIGSQHTAVKESIGIASNAVP